MTTNSEVESHFRMSDGFDLFYRHWRTTSQVDRVVLCIHGIGEHSGFFRSFGLGLATDAAEVFAIDLRGFGNSKEAGFSIGDPSNTKKYLYDVVEVVTHLRKINPGKRLFLAGHSIGGLHALWCAANNPNSVDGLILAGSSIESFAVGQRTSATLFVQMVYHLLLSKRAMFDLYRPASTSFSSSQEFRDHAEYLVNDPLTTGKFTWGYLASLAPLLRKAPQNASRTSLPALMIQGQVDGMVMPAGARRIFEKLASKDKTLRTFADADHYFYHTIFPLATSKYDPGRKKLVIDTIQDWVKTH